MIDTDLLRRRRECGLGFILLRADVTREAGEALDAVDVHSFAMDAVSNILTTLFGPAGGYQQTDGLPNVVYNVEAIRDAGAFLGAALRSYKSDAEDYEVGQSGNPGEESGNANT